MGASRRPECDRPQAVREAAKISNFSAIPASDNQRMDALLSLAPFVIVLSTSFVRIIVVLSLVRSAIGAAALPPNTVLTGLALILTFVIMTPTFDRDRKS